MKRLIDVLVSAVLLVILSPVLLVVALAVFVKLGSPIIFRQTRPGLHGQPFDVFKFRTMRAHKDSEEVTTIDMERLLPFGALLRRLSLDELPQLVNVLRGEMSLVGPRPLLMEYLPLYNDFQSRRHLAKPGMTGWAQIHGRNAITWDEKFELDVWYVENRTVLLDVKILCITVLRVIQGAGVNADQTMTMPKFGD